MSQTLHVLVRFGVDIPPDAQAAALMTFEKRLREITRLDCRVFKDKQGDDSKLRVKMTQIERDKL